MAVTVVTSGKRAPAENPSTDVVRRIVHPTGSVERLYADGHQEHESSSGNIFKVPPSPESTALARKLYIERDARLKAALQAKQAEEAALKEKEGSEFLLFLTRLFEATSTESASSLYAWAEPHGFNKQTLYNMISQNRVPGLEMLRRFSRATARPIDWLLGEDILSPATHVLSGGPAVPENTPWDEFVFIPRYDVKASAGSGHWHDNGAEAKFTVAFRRHWVENYLHAKEESLSVVRVHGDSMSPTLQDGDNILINHTLNAPQDGIYVIRMDGQILVKQTQIIAGKKLRVVSANQLYETFTIDLNADNQTDFEIIGRVVWFGRQM
ncbi:S24 family peptidase [Pararobbsia alpina]|uniref:Peptidase S24/S26A/S26B/S26C domain-containing protein n=1 Tax=Pararobbsia alpina TaxID=621374 RepID=A0A6S7CQU9_9BURK|nr:helix-turn-helix transcriptional regulator [Pararobbsia alpina]CAB3795559.1 hypothetical protein LMG28138_03904 [Pararobbsia alpina]